MKASCSAIKNKMLELTRLFCVESNLFQKFIIVYQYITLIDKDPVIKKILRRIFDNVSSNLANNFNNTEDCLNEDKFLNISSDIIRTQEFWTYYSNLKISFRLESNATYLTQKC